MFGKHIIRLKSVDSTNTRLKQLAEEGAPEGTVLLAGEQTAGRGTGNRSFFSPAGEGLYLSVLLRPKTALEELLTLTGRVAVAVREGIERACGARCRIKWLNDIYLNGRKVCGILAELSPGLDYVVVGIGVNVGQSRPCFAAQGLEEIATSLAAEGCAVEQEVLARSILEELERMYSVFPREKEGYLAQYRAHCLTLGRQVGYTENGEVKEGTAVAVDEDFALVVEGASGRRTVASGTVHLR